ncbi:C6 transcription factor [Colletotrichum truncatum]|uniref:C6 transcription factor n=1 Tax=Colletotrichum truncatum TaxID=5467 RepID=A0ACC3YHF9_COLTU
MPNSSFQSFKMPGSPKAQGFHGSSWSSLSNMSYRALTVGQRSPLTPIMINQLIEVFLSRLYLSMPFFKRSFILDNIKRNRHENDRQFKALVHSICAYTLFQAIHSQDRPLLPDRLRLAESVLSFVADLHGGADFGQDPTVETVITSFFLFGCQFCRGNHNAAQLRFREAMSLAEILRMHDPSSYEGLSPDEKDRRVRTVTALALVERIYTIQHGSTLLMPRLMGLDIMAFSKLIERASSISEATEDKAVDGLQRMIDQVGFVDETVVRCWKGLCRSDRNARHITAEEVVSLLIRYKKPPNLSSGTSQGAAQHADILLTRHWVRNLLWGLASRHGFISPSASTSELRPEYAVEIAADTIKACAKFDIRSLETHGVGLVEKLYDIASNCVQVAQSFPLREEEFKDSGRFFDVHDLESESNVASTNGTVCPVSLVGGSNWTNQLNGAELDWTATKPTQVEEVLNRFLALFSLFRKGKHPFLKPFMGLMANLDNPGTMGPLPP